MCCMTQLISTPHPCTGHAQASTQTKYAHRHACAQASSHTRVHRLGLTHCLTPTHALGQCMRLCTSKLTHYDKDSHTSPHLSEFSGNTWGHAQASPHTRTRAHTLTALFRLIRELAPTCAFGQNMEPCTSKLTYLGLTN